MKFLLPLLFTLIAYQATAQDGLIAYVPKKNIERAADSETIILTSTDQQGVYGLTLPAGTLRIDVLDNRGDLLTQPPLIYDGRMDVRGLRASTYTIRAHTAHGIRIRRFALLGAGASLWAIDAEPVR